MIGKTLEIRKKDGRRECKISNWQKPARNELHANDLEETSLLAFNVSSVPKRFRK